MSYSSLPIVAELWVILFFIPCVFLQPLALLQQRRRDRGRELPSDVSTLTYLPAPQKVEFCFCLLQKKPRSLPWGPSVLQDLFAKCSPLVPLQRKFLVTFPPLHRRLCTAKCQPVLHPRNIFPRLQSLGCVSSFSSEMPRAGNHHSEPATSGSTTAFPASKEILGSLGFPGCDSTGNKREMELRA